MNLTKNHVLNLLFWLVIIGFMIFQSIDHTINDHYKGVQASIRDYKFQAQTRINFLTNVEYLGGKLNETEGSIYHAAVTLKVTLDPIDYVIENERLTQLITNGQGQMNISKANLERLDEIQSLLNQEFLILYSHAVAFNSLISRFPYKFRRNNYKLFEFPLPTNIDGVVVER